MLIHRCNLFFLIIVAACSCQVQGESNDDSVIDKSRFVVEIGGTKYLQGIDYARTHVINSSRLSFSGLIVLDKTTNEVADECTLVKVVDLFGHEHEVHKCIITLDEFSMALEKSLSVIEDENNLSLDDIKVDVALVEGVMSEVVAALKGEVKKLSGPVENKNNRIDGAFLKAVEGSELVYTSCEILKKYKYMCDGIDMNPIAFESEYLGKNWMTILSAEDAGIKGNTAFFIRVKRDKELKKAPSAPR